MSSDAVLFAGMHISSGRKPVTFAALDHGLNVTILTQWDLPAVIDCLKEHGSVQLAIDLPSSKTGRELYQGFQEKIIETGFQPYSTKEGTRLWAESDAEECYLSFQPLLLSRRSLEGRLQRAVILYEEGLQISDPMDFFEEITRHKLLQGVLPTGNIYSFRELDALIMAYLSWMAGSPSEKVVLRDQTLLPKIIEND
ncbi:MAG: hypothetical protein ACM3XO_02475 [Bacteroidota bacterium]